MKHPLLRETSGSRRSVSPPHRVCIVQKRRTDEGLSQVGIAAETFAEAHFEALSAPGGPSLQIRPALSNFCQ